MAKKICHLLISYGNNNQTYTTKLVEGLQKASSDEHFVYCHWARQFSKHIDIIVSPKSPNVSLLLLFYKHYCQNGVFRVLVKTIPKKEILKWILLIDYGIDVLHVHHEHAISDSMLFFFKRMGVKIIISLRGRDLLVNTSGLKETDYLKAKLDNANFIHCISDFIKLKLQSQYNIDGTVIYRGQELPEFLNIKLYKTGSDSLKLIVVGRLVWEKGHLYLIESIKRLRDKGHQIYVDIYGEGDLREFLEFRIKQLQLEDNIFLKGYLENNLLKEKYKDYDLAVQPSLTEALSNGLIDFMFHNLPCVISDAGGMTEIIESGKNGIVFNTNDMMELDKAILSAVRLDFDELVNYNIENRGKFTSVNEIKNLLELYCSQSDDK